MSQLMKVCAGLIFLAVAAVLSLQGGAIVQGAYSIVQDEGVSVTQRQVLNFVGAGVSVADSGGKTVVSINGGGGGGGGNTITYGAYPTFPGSPVLGDTFYASNSPHRFAWSGSAWLPYYKSTGIPLATWDPSAWVLVNGAGTSLVATDVDQVLNQNGTLGATSDQWRGYQLAASLNANYSYTVHFDGLVTGVAQFLGVSLAVKESSTGKLLNFMLYNSGQYYVTQFNSETSANGNVTFGSWANMPGDIWFRIVKSGSGAAARRKYYISQNGVDYLEILDQQVIASWISGDEDTACIGWYTVSSVALTGQARVDSVSIQ